MLSKGFRFEVVKGETEHISFGGKRARRPTVLIRVGGWSMSKKAVMLGIALIACQVLDGFLTYLGLKLTVNIEGNAFVRQLMHLYGVAPALLVIKSFAIAVVIILTFYAHNRRWIRPLIFCIIMIYCMLAIGPWAYLISEAHMKGGLKPEAASTDIPA